MIAAESKGAWAELDTRLRPFVARRVASPADVDDVLQDTFLRMQRGIRELRDDERFGAWVYRVARSAIADHRRSRARHPLAVAPPAEPPSVVLDDADTTAEQELAGCVTLFTQMLPEPYREAITLTELEGLSQKEAARRLGLSHSGMKSRVQRGRERLRALFEECCDVACDARGRVVSYERREGCPAPARCDSRERKA
jgi:RNA polymerase sigma-70 factor, ECF subfamily